MSRCSQPTTDEVIVSVDVRVLELMAENAELRTQLAEAQEQCVELAVDAGELHARIEELQQKLAEARAAHRPEPTQAPDASQADALPVLAAIGAVRRAGR